MGEGITIDASVKAPIHHNERRNKGLFGPSKFKDFMMKYL